MAQFSAKDVAAMLNVDEKSFRSWLRRQTDQRAGHGGKWVFEQEDVDVILANYAKDHRRTVRPTFKSR